MSPTGAGVDEARANRGKLWIAVALVAGLALAVAGALALGGGDDEPRENGTQAREEAPGVETGSTQAEAPADGDESSETGTAEAPALERGGDQPPQSGPEPQQAPAPAPAPAPEPPRYSAYSASSGDWQTELPTGGGWEPAVESGGALRRRTSVRGPGGASLVIEHTPNAAARLPGIRRERRRVQQAWFGGMTELRLADGSVAYLLNASDQGPGFRVVLRGADPAIARRVANRLTYVDL